MNHLIEEEMERKYGTAKELVIESVKDRMNVIVETLKSLRRLKYYAIRDSSKESVLFSYQEVINELTGEYLELEAKSNKLQASE